MGREINPPAHHKDCDCSLCQFPELKLEEKKPLKKAPEYYSEEARKMMVEMFPDEYKL
jgi:hypothetical protein